MAPLSFERVEGRTAASRLWNELIQRYHYLGYTPMSGAQLRYFVRGNDGRELALLGFGAAAWRLAERDRFIGWDTSQREARLCHVVNNSRFLILPWVRSPNRYGSSDSGLAFGAGKKGGWGHGVRMIVSVPWGEAAYDVHVGGGLLDRVGELAAGVVKVGRCALISDSRVAELHGDRLERGLVAAGFAMTRLVVPHGERSKSLEVAGGLCEGMIEAGLDRSSCVFALGGGVVGDLAGFVAAIYYRGIPFVQVPTTIVAQVDSSVGGKTGVNAVGGKNLIGAFHQPKLVVADTDSLATLPDRERNQGYAEVIKHAAIRDFAMLDEMEDLPALMARNVAIKAAIVAEDVFETKGLRALLNFGHTIGHGIENAAGYGRFLHGEAISLGIVAATRLSVKKAGLDPAVQDRIFSALAKYALPMVLPEEVGTADIMTALRTDKKFASGAIRFVLLRAAGEAFVSGEVSEADILGAIEGLRNPVDCA